mgnify:CR=1 FL=1|jgi:hypothetical protein
MVAVSQIIPTPSPQAIASYDFQDIESGLGFKDFFAAITDLTGGAEEILTDDITTYSGKISTNRAATGTTSFTFDSSVFNLPRTVKGTAIFTCGIAGVNTASIVAVTARLQKWDGSTATSISSVITSSSFSATGAIPDKMVLLQLPLTQTIIKKGENLRLLVTFETNSNISADIGHDPRGRSEGSIGTNAVSTMKISIPFRIDI